MIGRAIRTFTVLPSLPEKLQGSIGWRTTFGGAGTRRPSRDSAHGRGTLRIARQQPSSLVGRDAGRRRWNELADDDGFLAHLERSAF